MKGRALSQGLLALLDDVALLAKSAAVSLDDVPAQIAKAGVKSAGVVIDDAAVTPRYVVGVAAQRELAVVGRIAWGSIKNKILILLPAALLLSVFAPWAITPLLMLGGGFLGYEGAAKLLEMLGPSKGHRGPDHGAADPAGDLVEGLAKTREAEDATIRGAVRTDLILSAEVMAISLATLPVAATLLNKALVLGLIGLFLTGAVYGAVALIVKADDMGLAMAQAGRGGVFGVMVRGFGRGLVQVMPGFLKLLATVGTVAMLWVGGEVLIHGTHGLGWHVPEDAVHHAVGAVEPFGGVAAWLVKTLLGAIVGLGFGLMVYGLKKVLILPAMRRFRPAPEPR
jgi:predicted DNA repair protein MutK